jgi:multidrug efflux pump subunit AcrB
MNLGRLSVNQPILAMVLSIVLLIVGAIAYRTLPVAEYPQVVPPTVVVTAQYPGASAQTISDTVAAPIEQQINGVDDMLYIYSQATSNGQLTITVTFKLGTDLDKAQVLVQNRVAIAQPQLPEEVQRNGVVTKKNSPDILMVVFMLSPDNTFDQIYISNYALLQVRDQLLRLDGIGDIQIFGARDYSMRLWLDPDKIANLGMNYGRRARGDPGPEPSDHRRPIRQPTDRRPRLPAEPDLYRASEGSFPVRRHRRQGGPGRPYRAAA